MRENRPYGSEGGEGSTLPDPYQERDAVPTVGARHCLALVRQLTLLHQGDAMRRPYKKGTRCLL